MATKCCNYFKNTPHLSVIIFNKYVTNCFFTVRRVKRIMMFRLLDYIQTRKSRSSVSISQYWAQQTSCFVPCSLKERSMDHNILKTNPYIKDPLPLRPKSNCTPTSDFPLKVHFPWMQTKPHVLCFFPWISSARIREKSCFFGDKNGIKD